MQPPEQHWLWLEQVVPAGKQVCGLLSTHTLPEHLPLQHWLLLMHPKVFCTHWGTPPSVRLVRHLPSVPQAPEQHWLFCVQSKPSFWHGPVRLPHTFG